MTHFRKLALPLVIGAGLAALATPAIAQDQDIVVTAKMKVPEGYEPVKRVVSIKDLDLTTKAGADEMERRVGEAVNGICALPKHPSNEDTETSMKCTDFAWAGARPQMEKMLQKARSQ